MLRDDGQRVVKVARDDVVDIADEAQRDVQVLGLDPAGARARHAQPEQLLTHVLGQIYSGEQSWHDVYSIDVRRQGVAAAKRRAIDARYQLLDRRHDALDDDADALAARMQAVALIEVLLHGHAVEEKGIEKRAVLRRQVLVDEVELVLIRSAPVLGRQHAGEQHLDVLLAQAGQDLVEICPRQIRVHAAQRVVGAELHDDRLGIVGNGPVETLEPGRGRIAGNAGIGDLRRCDLWL